MDDPLLRVEDVAAAVNGRELLSRIRFELGRGEAIGLVGETGSGKSMTCRVLTGTIGRIGGRVTRGRAVFDGIDLSTLDERGWRPLRGKRVALVPQTSLSSLDPVMTVRGQLVEAVNVLTGMRGRAARAEALRLLEAVQLADPERVLGLYPHQLSGGMRQRVMIALALAGKPDMLIADEPTTALDVTVQRGILDLLARLRAETGMALVLVTHDLGLVEELCERVAIVYAGMTVEVGTSAEVFSHPAHPYSQALLAARPAALQGGQRLTGIPGTPPGPEDWEQGCRFAPRCPYAIDACLAAVPALAEAGGQQRAACVRTADVLAGSR